MNPPPIIYINGSWQTVEPWNANIDGITLHIPKGFQTDLASVPRLLRSFVNTYELGVASALIHDAIYGRRGHQMTFPPAEHAVTWEPKVRFTRRAADRIFRQAMKAEGIGVAKRWVAWTAVRLFGWLPWPPSASTWRNAVTRSLHTGWQTAGGLLVCQVFGWNLWLTVPVAAGLSVATSLMVVPLTERLDGVIYR